MMNQEIQDDEVTIDLMELFSALWAKKTIIILSVVFMALVAFVGTKMFVTPKYTSVTKLFVMAKNDDTSASATYTDLQTGSMLTKDYMELVKSRPVLEKTISKLKLDVTPEELAGKIKDGAMCGLGQTAPNPVLTTIRYFRNEYEDHIYNHKCTARS